MAAMVVNYLLVDMVVYSISGLVTNILSGAILIIYKSVTVVSSSISPPISVTKCTFESLRLPWLVLSL